MSESKALLTLFFLLLAFLCGEMFSGFPGMMSYEKAVLGLGRVGSEYLTLKFRSNVNNSV